MRGLRGLGDRMGSSFISRRSESGLSLIEIMVVLIILVFGLSAALVVYNDSWRFFKEGENAIELQQAVRIGFDRLGSDLKMSGFNHNLDGDGSRPDEPVEAAFDTAVVIRADFDARNPTASTTPEASLAGGPFDSVSTGNDEIVAYVLAKPDGSSTGTLTFEADVKEAPRDGVVETVNISNVALVHDDPPYGLYRINLNNDTSTWAAADFLVRTLLAENVYALSFRYFNVTGGQINATFDLASTSDDIGGSEAAGAMAQRSGIRRIEVNLVGMTRDPDLGWVDPQDTNAATQPYRKFYLKGNITLRNAGMIGIEDL